jgi:hypothetical protein
VNAVEVDESWDIVTLLELPQQSTTDCVAQTTEIYSHPSGG